MREDPLDHRRFEDGGCDDLELAAAVRAVLQVDLKAKLQRRLTCTQVMSQLNTRLSNRAQLIRAGRPCSQPDSVAASSDSPVTSAGRSGTPMARSLALGASTPWKRIRCSRGRGTGAWGAPFGRSDGQALHELQRRHHDVGSAVAPRGLELEHHLPGGAALHAFVGQRRAPAGRSSASTACPTWPARSASSSRSPHGPGHHPEPAASRAGRAQSAHPGARSVRHQHQHPALPGQGHRAARARAVHLRRRGLAWRSLGRRSQ